MSDDISFEIKKIFDNNRLNDLKRFLNKRKNLNNCNSALIYLFYIFQIGGILANSIGTSYMNEQILWTGIGLNFLASLIQVFEKINDGKLKNLMKDIKLIKDGHYIDEGELINVDKDIEANISLRTGILKKKLNEKKNESVTNDLSTNNLSIDDSVANDYVTNDYVTNDYVTNDYVTNDSVANDSVANDSINNKLLESQQISDYKKTNDIKINAIKIESIKNPILHMINK